MGIINREGALYAATGIDNTGLYAGRREALGIIKAMAGEITSFDVFGGLGISAAVAFAQAAKGAYNFEKEFQKNMLEVATISTQVSGSMTDFMNQVLSITKEIPVRAPEAAKALYQIVSAGHDGAAGMKVLEVAAKAAVGGITETATAADAITTLINAYKMSADDAERVSDQLFTTARLGKTTFGELGKSISQVAPIAASYGVEMDQVLAAVATLTKSGTPTAQAMTQIRAAIIGVSKYLGDGAFDTMTFQEALDLVAKKANGSEEALRGMITEVEGITGLLGLTGINAKVAAGDLDEMNRSAGATEVAFKKMSESAEAQLQRLSNNITAALRPMGESILKGVSEVAEAFNTAFDNGDIQESIKNLGALIVTVTSALVGYKGSIIATTAAKTLYHAVTTWIVKQKAIEAANLVLTKGLYAAEAAVIAKNTGAHVLLTNALKAQFVAMLKNVAAMITNPYILAAAAVAALGYAVYSYCTELSAAEKAQKKFNESLTTQKQRLDDTKRSAEELISTIKSETATHYDKMAAYLKLQGIMPEVFKNMDIEKLKLMDILSLNGEISAEIERRERIEARKNSIGAFFKIKDIEDELKYRNTGKGDKKQVRYVGISTQVLQDDLEATKKEKELYDNQLNGILDSQKKARDAAAEAEKKELEKTNAEKLKNYRSELAKAEKAYNTLFAPKSRSTDQQRKTAKEKVDGWKGKIENITGKSGKQETQDANSSESLRKEQEKYSLLIDEQTRKRVRAEEDRWSEVWQTQIDAMEDGSEKSLVQMELNHEKELQALDREKEDLLQKKRDEAKAVFDANEEIKAKQYPEYKPQTFDGSGIALSGTENTQFDNKYKSTLDKQINDRKAYYDSEKQAMNEYLAAYGTYMQKRQAILDQAEAKKKGKSDWEKKSIDEETNKSLSDLHIEANKKTAAFSKLFSDMKDRSVKNMKEIANQAEMALEFVKGGQWDEKKGLELGISKETFDQLQKSTEEIENIEKEVKDLNGEVVNCDNSFRRLGAGFKKVFEEGADPKKLREGLAEIESGMNDVMQVAGFLSNTLSSLGDSFGNDALKGVAEGISVAMDAMGSAMEGAKAGAMFGPIGAAAGAAIGLVSSLASSFAKIHDAKSEKRIQRLQDQIDTLSRTYDTLGDAIDKAYSSDASKLIGQQNSLLEQQKQLIQNQILEEESKKNSDGGKIQEYKDRIGEIDKTIASNKDKAKDAIFGEDIKSAIDNFAQAYADAWATGNDRAKSSKDLVKNMIKQMIMEMIKMDVAKPMEQIREKIYEAMYGKKVGLFGKRVGGDGKVDETEQAAIEQMVENAMNSSDEKYAWADRFMKDDEDSTREASSKGIATASQDSVDENNGRLTMIQGHTYNINETLKEIVNFGRVIVSDCAHLPKLEDIGNNLRKLTASHDIALNHLSNISKYTENLVEMKQHLYAMKQGIDSMNTKGLTLKR